MTRESHINWLIQDTTKHWKTYYNVLPNLIRARGYKRGIEIGVFAGGHAKAMLDAGLDFLVGVDPYKIYSHGGMPSEIKDQQDFDCLCSIVIKSLDSSRFVHLRMTSDDAVGNPVFQEKEFDFVFIDGFHSYSQVKKDMDNYSKFIRKGGVISCHDYKHPSYPLLTRAIDEFAEQHNTKVVEGPLHAVYMEWNG
jgi:hypothetical protein